jgi:hypothetical protein
MLPLLPPILLPPPVVLRPFRLALGIGIGWMLRDRQEQERNRARRSGAR